MAQKPPDLDANGNPTLAGKPPDLDFNGNPILPTTTKQEEVFPIVDDINDSFSGLGKFLEYINKPLIDYSPEMKTAMGEFQQEHPYIGAAGNFLADTIASQSSPLSVGLGGTGVSSALATKLALPKLASALRFPAQLASGGLVAKGAYDVATGETLPEKAGGLLELGFGGLGLKANRKPLIPESPTPVAKIPPTLRVPVSDSSDIPIPERPTRLELPPAPSRPRFIAGEAGVADNQLYPLDMGPNPDVLSGTVPASQFGDISMVEPEIAANYGLSLGKLVPGPEPLTPLALATQTGYIGNPNLPAQLPSAIKNPRLRNAIATSGSPELVKAASDPEFVRKFVDPLNPIPESAVLPTGKKVTRNTPLKRVIAGTVSSVDTEISKQSLPLWETVKKVQTDSAVQSGTWTVKYDRIIKPISKTEWPRFVDAIEGKVKLDPIKDAKLVKALSEFQQLDTEVSASATGSGMGLKSSDGTKMVPWQSRENYWPHLYTEEFFNSLANNPQDLVARLTSQGMSPLEIDAILKNSKRFGERLIASQHGRESHLPGYRVDADVYRQHLDEMARRIKESEYYGPMDLADNKSPLMNLIRETNNPEYTTELMKKLLNRDIKGNKSFNDISRKIIGAQAWMHLGTSAISNLNTWANSLIHTNNKSFAKGLADTIFNSQTSGEFSESTGAIKNIFREIFAQEARGQRFSPTRIYGLEGEERWMRSLSANTGKYYAKELFSELKTNPNNTVAASRLRNLILEDPNTFLKQPELNPVQLKRAAFRVAELSQGLADKQNLPEFWTGSGMANLLTLFHRYAFAQTKVMKDLIKSDPKRAIPLLFGMSQVMGELTGDAKAAVRGGVKAVWTGDSNKVGEEIENRPEWLAKKFGLDPESLTARMAENAMQSFALGIFADVIQMSGESGTQALSGVLGSTYGDAVKVFDIGRDVGLGTLNKLKGEEAPEFGKAITGATSLLPIVGPPIASELRKPNHLK